MIDEVIVEDVEAPRVLDYSSMTLAELKAIAKNSGLEGYSRLSKSELIKKLG